MSFQSNCPVYKTAREHYLSLDTHCLVTYVWIDQTGVNLENKTRTFDKEPAALTDIPEWNAVWLVQDELTEVYLVPVRIFRDPFLCDPNKLVLCEVVDRNKKPAVSNHRTRCAKVMNQASKCKPWFGMEQEFMLLGLDSRPYGWPSSFKPTRVSCGVGLDKVCGRDISMCHYKACLYAGIKVFGTNAEFLTSQWEFQVGTCEGIEMGDHLWMSRFILHRVCEDFGVVANLDVVPVKDIHLTSGCHANFSTEDMRSEDGLKYIQAAINKLSKRHHQHLLVYDPHQGRDNMSRLTSRSSTSSYGHFSSGVADRNVSVRIPGVVSQKGCGYLEDRRPASNCDPYLVTMALIQTCQLDSTEEEEKQIQELEEEVLLEK